LRPEVRLVGAARAHDRHEVAAARSRELLGELARLILRLVEQRHAAAALPHRRGVVDHDDVVGHGRHEAAAELRARNQHRQQQHGERSQHQHEPLLHAQALAVALQRLEQLLHRGPTHLAEATAVEQVDDDGHGRERRCP